MHESAQPAKTSTLNSLPSAQPVSIQGGCSLTSCPDRREQRGPGWGECWTTPAPATPSWSRPSTGAANPVARLARRHRHSHPDWPRGGGHHGHSRRTRTGVRPELGGRERRAASRESRRARQLPATKPPKLTADRQEQLRRLAATGEPVRELAAAFGIGRATAYRYLISVRELSVNVALRSGRGSEGHHQGETRSSSTD